MGSKVRKSILKTLLYSDIFDYPLRKEEIWRYLISEKPIAVKVLTNELCKMESISEKDGYYSIKERGEIVLSRLTKKEISLEKQEIAKKVAGLLSKIPTVECIFLSGGLAMENVGINDDIDFFIITSRHAIWTTRFFSILLLDFFGYRRRRKQKNFSNKICLNFFISEETLSLQNEEMNIYSAHEIAQLKLLFQRNNTYKRFLKANDWIQIYLPNVQKDYDVELAEKRTPFLSMFEHVFRLIQLAYMRTHRTTERISSTMLAFHPRDYKKFVLKEYNKRLRKHKLL